MSDLNKMAGEAIHLGQGKYDGMTIQWRDTFPEDVGACPFQPPQNFPDQRGKQLTITRVFHPCVGERCQVWDRKLSNCGARTRSDIPIHG